MMAPGIGGANRLCRLGQRAIDTSPRHSARTDRCAPTRISPHGVPSPPHPAVPKRSAASLALPMAGRRQLRSCGCGPRPPCRFDLKRIMYRSKFDTNCRSSIMNPSISAAIGTMDMDRQRDPLLLSGNPADVLPHRRVHRRAGVDMNITRPSLATIGRICCPFRLALAANHRARAPRPPTPRPPHWRASGRLRTLWRRRTGHRPERETRGTPRNGEPLALNRPDDAAIATGSRRGRLFRHDTGGRDHHRRNEHGGHGEATVHPMDYGVDVSEHTE